MTEETATQPTIFAPPAEADRLYGRRAQRGVEAANEARPLLDERPQHADVPGPPTLTGLDRADGDGEASPMSAPGNATPADGPMRSVAFAPTLVGDPGRTGVGEDAAARWVADRVASHVSATVWGSLPYTRVDLRTLVGSLEQVQARLAVARAQAAASRAAVTEPEAGGAA